MHYDTRSDTLQYQSQSVDTINISQRDQSKNVLINCRYIIIHTSNWPADKDFGLSETKSAMFFNIEEDISKSPLLTSLLFADVRFVSSVRIVSTADTSTPSCIFSD